MHACPSSSSYTYKTTRAAYHATDDGSRAVAVRTSSEHSTQLPSFHACQTHTLAAGIARRLMTQLPPLRLLRFFTFIFFGF